MAAAALLVAPLLAVAQQRPSVVAPADSAVVVERDVMIPMRDGKRMATDIYRPARNGVAVAEKLPLLLHRTPYDKSDPATQTIAASAAAPYV